MDFSPLFWRISEKSDPHFWRHYNNLSNSSHTISDWLANKDFRKVARNLFFHWYFMTMDFNSLCGLYPLCWQWEALQASPRLIIIHLIIEWWAEKFILPFQCPIVPAGWGLVPRIGPVQWRARFFHGTPLRLSCLEGSRSNVTLLSIPLVISISS
jgi:hypothetical protein